MRSIATAQQRNQDVTEISDSYSENLTASDTEMEDGLAESNLAHATVENAGFHHSFRKQTSKGTGRQRNGDIARNVPSNGIARGNSYESCESMEESDQHNGNEIWYK